MSTNRGVAPQSSTAFSVATNVNAGTITSSPGPTSSARSDRISASVPLSTATAWAVPVTSRTACSNRSTIGPCTSRPDRSTSRTSSSSSGRAAAR